jgi:hypothetical protein
MFSNHSTGATTQTAMVSPRQAAVGTFFGGPVALIVFLRKNYLSVGDNESAKRTLLLGFALLLAWNVITVLGILLPEAASFPFALALKVAPFVCVIAARQVVQKQLASAPRQFDFYSNWSVAGIALACLLTSICCLLPAIIVVSTFTYLQTP